MRPLERDAAAADAAEAPPMPACGCGRRGLVPARKPNDQVVVVGWCSSDDLIDLETPDATAVGCAGCRDRRTQLDEPSAELGWLTSSISVDKEGQMASLLESRGRSLQSVRARGDGAMAGRRCRSAATPASGQGDVGRGIVNHRTNAKQPTARAKNTECQQGLASVGFQPGLSKPSPGLPRRGRISHRCRLPGGAPPTRI
jgi:hypothetical protein